MTNLETVYGVTVTTPVLLTVPSFPVIVTLLLAVTAVVFNTNVALVAVAGTKIVVPVAIGTTAVFELLIVTVVPPAGAGALRVTVTVVVNPPCTGVGLRPTESRTGASTVNVAVFVTPPAVAPMVEVLFALTGIDVIGNVILDVPAATVTLAGTVAMAVLLLASVTNVPPAGALPVRVIVPTEGVPP